MTQAAKIPPLALHRPTPRAPEAVCPGGRFYSSVLWTVPQNSAKMEKKKAMGCGEGLCQLIGFSCPLVGSMEEEVAGPAIKMTKGHQCMAKNKILNSKPPENPRLSP